MDCRFYYECEGIFRLKVPFEKIFTSVFLLERDGRAMLIDCATTDEDVDLRIIPALSEMGYAPADLFGVLLTHRHGDHAGGLPRLLSYAPDLKVISRAEASLFGGFSVYPLPGHTEDSIGVFDTETGTLISGDGLQGEGVDRYRCSVSAGSMYFETLRRINRDKRIQSVLFSHAYEPWNSEIAIGRGAVEQALADCLVAARKVLQK